MRCFCLCAQIHDIKETRFLIHIERLSVTEQRTAEDNAASPQIFVRSRTFQWSEPFSEWRRAHIAHYAQVGSMDSRSHDASRDGRT